MPQPVPIERQVYARRTARAQLSRLRAEARKSFDGRQRAAQASADRESLRRANAAFADTDPHRATVYYTALLGLLAVYVLDCLLFSRVAEFFMEQHFPNLSSLQTAGLFIIPATILLLEILVSAHRVDARHERLSGGEGWTREACWTAGSLLLLCVMPAAVLATYLADEDDFDPWVSGPLLLALAGLSLLAHLTVLFGGRLAIEAKTYAAFRARERRLTSREARADKKARRHQQRAADLFADYFTTVDRHNREQGGGVVQAGPFDQTTRDVVNREYGYEAIVTANQEAPGRVVLPAGGDPSPAPDPTTLAMPGDWRVVGAPAWQADDTEVRA